MTSYEAQYRDKRTTPTEIAQRIQDGQQIWADITLAQPPALLEAIGARAQDRGFIGVGLNTALDIYPMPYLRPQLLECLTSTSLFCGGETRRAVNGGYGDVLPGYYRDYPSIIREQRQVDVFCAAVSPMDKHGYFSVSTVGSFSEALLAKAQYVFLEVNRNLPRSLSAPAIHISQVTALCENTVPLPCLPPTQLDEVSRAIGGLIAEEIPDGATIQLGIGAIPDAVGLALKNKRHLGIHTEMFTDSMVELIEDGVVDNSRKPIHRGRSVATFAFGSQRIYDYIDDNRAIELLPVDYVNDPAVIARHPSFVSVNAALEVDFFGQVSAESVGCRIVSGTGGQADYVRGAIQSPGGQSFIAFPSTAKGGTVSKIVPTLTPGALISTSKNDVDNVVTEYGIARLRGRSLSQRAKALISIAHPKFRDELVFAAKRQNILI